MPWCERWLDSFHVLDLGPWVPPLRGHGQGHGHGHDHEPVELPRLLLPQLPVDLPRLLLPQLHHSIVPLPSQLLRKVSQFVPHVFLDGGPTTSNSELLAKPVLVSIAGVRPK
jgi:hypothetical protein